MRHSASMTTWTTILDDTQAIAKDKMTLADQMNLQVAEQVRSLQLRAEGIRERVMYLVVACVADETSKLNSTRNWEMSAIRSTTKLKR